MKMIKIIISNVNFLYNIHKAKNFVFPIAFMNLHKHVMQHVSITRRGKIDRWLNSIRFIALWTDLTLTRDDEKKQRGKKNIYTRKHRKQWAYVINIENYRQLNSQDHGSRVKSISRVSISCQLTFLKDRENHKRIEQKIDSWQVSLLAD